MSPIAWIWPALLSVLANAGAQVAIRQGLEGRVAGWSLSHLASAALSQPLVWLGLLLYAFSLAVWFMVLAKVPASTAYPLAAVGYVAVVLVGTLILHEPMTAGRASGIALIVLGTVLLSH